MAQLTPWEFSNAHAEPEPVFTEGLKTVKIVDAKYYDGDTAPSDKQKFTYVLTIQCVEDGPCNGARTRLTFWMKDSKTGQTNNRVVGTLVSLSKALFGEEIDTPPAPCDVKGGVVVAEIKMKENEMGQSFPKVYHFMPASDDFDIYSDLPGQRFRASRPAPLE